MTSTEFWLAWLFNLRGVAVALAIVSAIVTAVLMLMVMGNAEWSNSDKKVEYRTDFHERAWYLTGRRWWPRALAVALASALFGSAPGPEDLWHLRVSLMKLELVSPENFNKLADHATEVVKALECKHLGVNCPEKESK